MDIGDQKKGSRGIDFPFVPLANMKIVVLLQKLGLLFTHNLGIMDVKTMWNIYKMHVLRKTAKDQESKDACVELVYLNPISSRCLQDSVIDR